MSKKELTNRQKDVYNQLVKYYQDRGYPPSYADLAEILHISRESIRQHIEYIEQKGWIEKDEGVIRSVVPKVMETLDYEE